MQNCIHSGYTGIYQPTISLEGKEFTSTIFCLSTRLNTCFVMIPLTNLFSKDAIFLASNTAAKSIYIIASDISIIAVSDYYNTWDYIKHTLKKECKIFSKYMPENYTSEEFKSDIIRDLNDNISIDVPRSDIDHGVIDISLVKTYVHASNPFSCDVIVNDTYKKRYFIGEMNEHKAKFLYDTRDSYDELHMAHVRSGYGGMTYQQFIAKYPVMVTKTFVNRFSSYEEYQYAKERGLKIGSRLNTVRWW